MQEQTDLDRFTRKMLSQWDWSREERALGGSRACSPESECFDSACSSPDARAPAGRHDELRRPKAKMSTKRRMKASEREKLRMRGLAEALHQLREYLPQGHDRRGQPLTKIQTLKSTIQYINELASLLEQQP